MKKVILCFSLLFICQLSAKSQNDVSTNFLYYIFEAYSASYQHGLSDESSLGGSFTYVDSDKLTGFRIMPEYRFYFDTKHGNDGFFVGPYLNFSRMKRNDVQYTVNGITSTQNFKVIEKQMGLSLNLGRKWVTSKGFFFSVNGGIGRFLINEASFEDSSASLYLDEPTVPKQREIDYRFGLNLGWRFK